jgi:hypothetical protein
MVWEVEVGGGLEIVAGSGMGARRSCATCKQVAWSWWEYPPPYSNCSDDMRGGGWRLDGDLRYDADCDDLCEDVSELEAHTRLQESNWELLEYQSGGDYDDSSMEQRRRRLRASAAGAVSPVCPRLPLYVFLCHENPARIVCLLRPVQKHGCIR